MQDPQLAQLATAQRAAELETPDRCVGISPLLSSQRLGGLPDKSRILRL